MAGNPFCDGSASRAAQPLAIFYGSGDDFLQPHVPDELRWSPGTLDVELASGRTLLLDVIVALKSGMPESWLEAHGMSGDFLSLCFSKSQAEIVGVYAAALRAWGAADVLAPPSSDAASKSQRGGGAAAGAAAVGRSAQGGAEELAIPSSDSSGTDRRGQLLLQLTRMFFQELQICLTSHPAAPAPPADLSIDGFDELQSVFLSARYAEGAGRNSDAWVQLSSQLPQVFTLSCREHLFRKISGTSENDLQRLKKDRVNDVERSCILDWAASIAAAMRGRRNPLAIQVQVLLRLICWRNLALILWCVSLDKLLQFIKDGVPELGFGEAITKSFFCELADAFSKGELCDTGTKSPNVQLFLSISHAATPLCRHTHCNGSLQGTLACGSLT